MQYLKTYLKTISSRGNEKLAESISHTAEDVGNRYIKSFSFCSHEIGLLFGNVQSGKTGQMFGIISKATNGRLETTAPKAGKDNDIISPVSGLVMEIFSPTLRVNALC